MVNSKLFVFLSNAIGKTKYAHMEYGCTVHYTQHEYIHLGLLCHTIASSGRMRRKMTTHTTTPNIITRKFPLTAQLAAIDN